MTHLCQPAPKRLIQYLIRLMLSIVTLTAAARGDSIRPWGGAYVQVNGYHGSTESMEGVGQSVELSSQQKHRWAEESGSSGLLDYPDIKTITAFTQAQTSANRSQMITIKDKFETPYSPDFDKEYQTNPAVQRGRSAWNFTEEEFSNANARAEWRNDSIQITAPAGLQTPERVRLLFDFKLEQTGQVNPTFSGSSLQGDLSISVNEKSIQLGPVSESRLTSTSLANTSYNGPYYGQTDKPTPGSDLDRFFDGGFEARKDLFGDPYSSGDIYKQRYKYVSTANGRFSIDLNVGPDSWTENFTAIAQTSVGDARDIFKSTKLLDAVTLGLVDVTTIDGTSLQSLGYKLTYASDLTMPSPVPEPASWLVGTIIVVACLLHKQRLKTTGLNA